VGLGGAVVQHLCG